jgi:hypothetical protein
MITPGGAVARPLDGYFEGWWFPSVRKIHPRLENDVVSPFSDGWLPIVGAGPYEFNQSRAKSI